MRDRMEALFLSAASCDDFFMEFMGRWIVGIDEVGRGALAGPVVVAAAAIPRGLTIRNAELGALKDSKKLTAKQREAWDGYLNNHPDIHFALARVYPRQIEKQNISRAANIAAERAFGRLFAITGKSGNNKIRTSTKTSVFLDGGLFLGNGTRRQKAKTVIKGDEKISAIKIASIIAKVYRDRLMRRLGKKYPQYNFEIHKGYATLLHRTAIKKHGPSTAHRLTFLGKSVIMRP